MLTKRKTAMLIAFLFLILCFFILALRRYMPFPPLVQAIYSQQTSKVYNLLERHASPNQRLSDGTTVLMLSASVGHLAITKLLVKYGAYINVVNYQGITALMAAAASGNSDTVKWLLIHGANPCVKDHKGQTAFNAAIFWGQSHSARILKKASENCLANSFGNS